MFNFKEKIVVVTGAAGNLGEAVAHSFLKAGARMILVDRAVDRLPKMFPNLIGSSEYFLATSIDSTDADSIQELVTQSVRRFGRIDVLVNTVGGYQAGKPLHLTPLKTIDYMFNLNARTTYIASQAVIPIMLKQGAGKIVNVSSRQGLAGTKNSSAYSAAKAAVIRLTESMSAELKLQNINVNCVLPGTIDTPQNRSDMPNADYNRWVKPNSLAGVILFLASQAAQDIHGAVLPVYGKS